MKLNNSFTLSIIVFQLIAVTGFAHSSYPMDTKPAGINAKVKAQIMTLLEAEIASQPHDLSQLPEQQLQKIISACAAILHNNQDQIYFLQRLGIKSGYLENLLGRIARKSREALKEPKKPQSACSAPVSVKQEKNRDPRVWTPGDTKPAMPVAASSPINAPAKTSASKTKGREDIWRPGDTKPKMPEAASSAVTQPQAAIPQAAKSEVELEKKVSITDENKLAELAQKYQQGIPVKGIPNLTRLKLTKKSLEHVFGITLGSRGQNESVYLSGFHHDFNLKSDDEIFMRSLKTTGHGISEGFIAVTKYQIPAYKTFFSSSLSEDQVIAQMISSLHNIQTIDLDPDRMKNLAIDGMTPEGVLIRTIVNKNTGEIITFFPLTQKSEAEIEEETKKIRALFKKFFFDPSKKTKRQPITQDEISDLATQYQVIPFNKVIGRFNTTPVFIDVNQLPALQQKYQNRIVVESAIGNLHITPATLQEVFSDKNDPAFPEYLSRNQIMNKLIQALNNTIGKVGQMPGNYVEDAQGPQPITPFKRRDGNLISFRGLAEGSSGSDSFVFFITIDATNGNIVNFFPLFG